MDNTEKCEANALSVFGVDYKKFIKCNVCPHHEDCKDEYMKKIVNKKATITGIILVDALDFPDSVVEYCNGEGLDIGSTDILEFIPNDKDNEFAKWLVDIGYVFKDDSGDYVGILGVLDAT